MDDQVFNLVNRRSDSQDKSLDRIEHLLLEHIEKDGIYWRKIDVQDAQLSMLKKTVLGMVAVMTTIVSAIWAWITR